MAKKNRNQDRNQRPSEEDQSPEGQEGGAPSAAQPSLEDRVNEFIFDYKRELGIGVAVIAVLILGYVGYQQLILAPVEAEAEEEMYRAQWAFENDSLENALHGVQGEFMGFRDITREYSGTSAGNLAHYYAGVISLRLDEYEEAIDYLQNFHTESKMFAPLRLGVLGDAHSQLGEHQEAADYYLRAGEKEENPLTAPVFFKKAGLTFEQELENYDRALEAYNEIEDNYEDTRFGDDIVKYISRVESKIESGTGS